MVCDREQAIEIEATIEAFLTSRTKHQVLTRLRDACICGRPIPEGQLGEQRKRESLATFLGDKEVCVSEARNRSSVFPRLTRSQQPQTLTWLHDKQFGLEVVQMRDPSPRRPCRYQRSRNTYWATRSMGFSEQGKTFWYLRDPRRHRQYRIFDGITANEDF